MPARKKFDPKVHDENPEWTAADFAKSRPAEQLPPQILSQFKNPPGRPRLESPKEAIKLRLDADVLAALRNTGPGWQTRINDDLRAKMRGGKIVFATANRKRGGGTAPTSAKRKRA